jgi:hypothetical protein
MLSLTRSSLFVAAALLALCLLATRADAGKQLAGEPAKLDADYAATLFGIPIGHISWTIELHDDHFSATASGETAGLMRIFAHGHGVAKSRGVVTQRHAAAADFMVNYVSGNSSDAIRIIFQGGKAKEHLAHPPQPNPRLVPLTEAYRVGVVDPMTALLIDVPGQGATAAPPACVNRIAVFDGRMRYDLHLVFKRIEQVKAESGYQGPAVVCALQFFPLAGYDPGRYAIRYLRAQRNMEVWLAPLTGTRLMVPFRIAVPTPIGLGVLQATRFVWTREDRHASAIIGH